jgi:molecular chaperone HscB
MNYFEFFHFPLAFTIDQAALKKAYYANSKQFHPDYHSLADETQQAWALEQSTVNNQAYAVLADDDQRMRHLLEIKGLLGDTSVPSVLPPDFLMDMMDINEAIMDLQMDFDAGKYESTLKEVESIENQLLESVSPILLTYTDDGNQEQHLEVVKIYLLKKKYLLRIRENLSTFASAF